MKPNDQAPEEHAGWNAARPERMPTPTWWPAALAFGITLCAWGLISSWLMFGAGMLVTAVSLRGWILDILHEQEHDN